MIKCLIALTTLFPAAISAATVWTWVDEQGQRHFSDREVPGATRMEIDDVQTFSGSALLPDARPAVVLAAEEIEEPVATVTYRALAVVSPEPEQTLRNIGGNLSVELTTDPALASVHRVDVILDGERKNLASRSLSITVPEVWRGEHTLQAVIVDSDGTVLKTSNPVTFYVQQTSVLLN